MKIRLFFLICPVFVFTSLFAQAGRKQVEEGNKLFAEEKYDEAQNKYRDALIDNPESPIIHFNMGDVLYRKRNFEEAIKSFEKATNSDDVMLQSKSYYNIGNSLYRMGKLPESILMYRRALELNPDDEHAKYNIEFVRRKLREQANEQSQDNQNQQQQQNQQQEQQKGDQQDQEQKQEEQQQEQQQNQEEGSQDQQNQEQQQEQQASEAQEISKEDAERILNALENEEQDLLQQQKGKKRGRAFRGKDW
ncbi:tetratricopeptide repeat protein [bacterium]|nr:tetratricopeptide repeat protein [bacterium]